MDTKFGKGHIPWNRGKKGIHLSPQSEFKKGQKPVNWDKVGTIKIRERKRDGQLRNFIKIAEPNIWEVYAKHLWLKKYKRILKGDIVHHLDGNSSNDVIKNLIALPRTDHPIFHSRWGIKQLTNKQIQFYKARYR